jgi:hypothetical protein
MYHNFKSSQFYEVEICIPIFQKMNYDSEKWIVCQAHTVQYKVVKYILICIFTASKSLFLLFPKSLHLIYKLRWSNNELDGR